MERSINVIIKEMLSVVRYCILFVLVKYIMCNSCRSWEDLNDFLWDCNSFRFGSMLEDFRCICYDVWCIV